MIAKFKKYTELLDASEKRGIKIVMSVNALGAFLDMIGVASIFPFMTVVENPEKIEENSWLKLIYDVFDFQNYSQYLIFLGICVISFTLLSLSYRVLSTYMSMRFVHNTIATMTQRYFNAAVQQNYLWFSNQSNSELNTKILGEVENYASRVLLPIINFISAVMLTFVMLVIIVLSDPKIALIIIAYCTFFFTGIYVLISGHVSNMGKIRTEANSDRFSVLLETFEGIKTVKVFNLENILSTRFKSATSRYAKSQRSLVLIKQLPKNILEAITVILIVTAILIMMLHYGFASIPIGLFSLYALAGYRLIPAIQNIFSNASTLRYSDYAVEKLKELKKSFHPVRKIERISEQSQKNSDVSINNLSFKRDSHKRILDNISLEIPYKSRIAFVGPSGCGKTTLVDHIMGIISPQEGEVLFGGESLEAENKKRFQSRIGYVPQDVFLMKETLAKNISLTFDDNGFDEEKVWSVLDVVNLKQFAENQLPNGLMTVIGDGHHGFSGGQKQRIGIARALYHSIDAIIMDEATSALDLTNEKQIMKKISKYCESMTMVLITHRHGSIEHLDHVIEMKDGKIISKTAAETYLKQMKTTYEPN